jgi:aquaporin Z
MRAYVTEFIGTFFLVLTVGLVMSGGKTDEPFLLAPLAIGCSLMIMVYMGGHISGGHYNPAVSTAVFVRGKLPARDFVMYLIAQLIGAICAGLAVYAILGKTFAPAPAANVTALRALFVEFLYTFALCIVMLNVATAPATAGNSYFGLAIGFTIVVAAIAGGGISGGAFNPAVGTGPILVKTALGAGTLANLWIYIVGPIAGGIVAGLVFRFQNPSAD